MLCFIYLPRCGLQIETQDINIISFGLSGIFAILVYRFS